jgi:hypothetical protein
MRIKYLAVLAAGLAMACASTSTGASGSTAGVSSTTRRNPNVITREEIEAAHVYNAYDAVQTLRPAFFHSHGSNTMSASDNGLPKVYLNHQLYGDTESLRNLEVSAIREIHYYNGPEASNRFGLGNVAGAIEVITDAQ